MFDLNQSYIIVFRSCDKIFVLSQHNVGKGFEFYNKFAPQGAGLWLGSCPKKDGVEHHFHDSVDLRELNAKNDWEWRRLTNLERTGFANGQMPWNT